MNVGNVGSKRLSQLPSAGNGADDRDASTGGEAAQTEVSGPGQLLGKLTRLQQADPVRFREAVSSVAFSLKQQAEKDAGGGRFLTELATKFAEVANGGDIAQLKAALPAANESLRPRAEPSLAARSYRANSIPPGSPGREAEKQVLGQVLQQLQSALGGTASAA